MFNFIVALVQTFGLQFNSFSVDSNDYTMGNNFFNYLYRCNVVFDWAICNLHHCRI